MTLERYIELMKDVNSSHELFETWNDLRLTIGKLLLDSRTPDKLRETYDFVSEHCKTLKNDMEQAEAAISTAEARAMRRNYSHEIYFFNRGEEVGIENAERCNYDDDYTPFEPISYVLDTPSEPIDYISLGMGV